LLLPENSFRVKYGILKRIVPQFCIFSEVRMSVLRSLQQLRSDVFAVWNAAVDGVRVAQLIRNHVSADGEILSISGIEYPIRCFRNIVVVGAGKASGAMAKTLEEILRPIADKIPITGWVNVPADCAVPLQHITLHPARPVGVNEPTAEALHGTQEIIKLLLSLEKDSICINLLSGGGSALLTAPEDGITLQDKTEVTRFLSEAGASINELNAVRKKISKIKGGAMKDLCCGKQLITLIVSDVIGDRLDVIASGPTVDNTVSAAKALDILQDFMAANQSLLNCTRRESFSRIMKVIEKKKIIEKGQQQQKPLRHKKGELIYDEAGGFVQHIIIGNNTTAVEAAVEKSVDLGYYYPSAYVDPAVNRTAEETGIELAKLLIEVQNDITSDAESPHVDMFIHGGEPVVHLAPKEICGKGGRNQQLVLAALDYLLKHYDELNPKGGIMFLSGGTDGEDGPTDAAGAYFDSDTIEKLYRLQLETSESITESFLKWNDAYHFLEKHNLLIKTGITGTNVCDVRVIAVCRHN